MDTKQHKKQIHDPRGVWMGKITRKREYLLEKFWTLFSYGVCRLWKVEIGAACRFWGRMYFRRAPGSVIRIGHNCRFRSAPWSNMAGLNHPCSISTLKPGASITIGNGSGISGTTITAALSIAIGENVLCGANVSISDTDWHHICRQPEGDSPVPTAPIIIGDNVWLAMNVVVLKGVTIGNNSVIGANSVVTKDIPANVLAVGQPAKAIRFAGFLHE